MEMQRHKVLLLLYASCIVASLRFCCGSITRGSSNKSCIKIEQQALVLLKENLVDDFNYLSSWVGDDCCAWHGIVCHNITGHITRLDLQRGDLRGGPILPSLLDLKYLTYLDLSSNNFNGQIQDFFGSFKDLAYLNLSKCNFKGLVPHHLGNLSSLRYLDLRFNNLLNVDSVRWLSKPSLLEYLDLSWVSLSSAIDGFQAINTLPNSVSVLLLYNCKLSYNIHRYIFEDLTSLVSLDLGTNHLNTSFPLWIFNNSGLIHVNLGRNYFSGTIPKDIGSLTSLSELDLSGNFFQGLIPESIGALTSLTSLHLSYNDLNGFIPKSMGRLSALLVLDLSFNNFQGRIPEAIGNLTLLSTLSFRENKLNGSIPPELGNLTELTDLSLSRNELGGRLPEAFCQLSKLKSLEVNNNQLSGSIPSCIGQLSYLISMELDYNSWDGFISETHFANLTRLTSLSISSNSNLVGNVSSDWIPPFQLHAIYMESLKVGPKFPNWLLTQKSIISIRMRNTSMSDPVPAHWFESLLLYASIVDLSNNEINGEQQSSISEAPDGLFTLLLSNNRLSGEFPAFLCNITSLTTSVISNNNLSGELPRCLGYMTGLTDLDVMNNSLSGDIPISLGSLPGLQYLNLHNNKFQGKLPLSFQNLTQLVALDVGKNNLRDILPRWTREQPYLKILILRSNNFYGEIPTELCHYSSIQILNLARNQIKGEIPSCFSNFSGMITSGSKVGYKGFFLSYGEMITDNSKGYELEYTSTLGFLISIDLSDNIITGEIPEELMDLHGLLNLNLAGNNLVGKIPNIGKLKKLEFLDPSRNELYGPIPPSLSELNFLSRLNLSYNDLSGRIPSGYQLQTLDDPSIYVGNNKLCGRPILKPCDADTESHNVHDYNEADPDDKWLWFYGGIGPGMLVGFLGFCASLHFIKSWRYSYFHYVEQVVDKIEHTIALLWRKFCN